MSWFSSPPSSPRWAYALTAIVTVTSGPLHAQNAQSAQIGAEVDDPDAPVILRAEEITGRPDREINLERDVELIKGATRMTARSACYKVVDDVVKAKGDINMWRFGNRYKGDELELNLDSGQGWVLHPEYRMQLNNAQGKANRIDFVNEDVAVITDGTYSTCEGPSPDWYLKADTLRLDSGRDVGTAGKTVVYFKGVPIIGTPAMSFSLSGARRSGWLPPTFSPGSKGSTEVMMPYYFNLAPNRDLTVFPRVILTRGLQMGATGRYIGHTDSGSYSGETHAELLINDQVTDTNRWLINSLHSQAIAPGWSYGWVLRAASDNEYPSDFSKSVANSAERQLLRELRTDYQSKYWSLTARAQNYQVLQDPAAAANPSLAVPRPYDRLPQINFHAGRYDVAGFDWALDAEVTRFWHPDLIHGSRAVAVPQLSYPIIRPGYFITPKVMVHASKYQLDRDGSNLVAMPGASLTRVLPTFSLDSGLVFERESKLFGRAVTQTLEPRLFYVRTPYKDQSQFPNFDTAEAGFNFAQIFTENRFIGADRISDANQVTAALVSRYIESNGAERLRLALGQRFYFSQQRVRLDPSTQLNVSRSDVLLAASGRVADNWSFDSAIQYNASARSVFSSNYGVQWLAGAKKVVNAEYRYQRDSFKNVDLSSQWPLSLRWFGVGRVSYSLRDKKVLESLIGLEYQADCWVLRMGAQRFVTAAQTTSSSLLFQLELNGLSKLGLGSNPLDTFYKSIPGYSRLGR
ncbi:OstA organic solvent tolerance protein [Massilia eurypsychrophila]|jgi:LPS-assembly protein|uniref:LPS-assembly protein LptD n=1 Tax=Massilia eurypsychrophila TaxID=1485217 RepID=A0A2G8TK65_9BURK|nr:LPS-assembly protein LptD [Massilia eurypsychrophila]PIL46445.1 OstA organic solvent tolerance protein [Massilia eurypsychrophila]